MTDVQMFAQWLGVLPDNWAVMRPKVLFSERRSPNNDSDIHLTPSQTHGVLPQTEYIRKTGNRVVLNLEGSDSMKHVEPDDFIIHLRSFQGGIEHSALRGKVSAAYTVLTPRSGADPRFFRWTLKSHGYIQSLQATVNQLRDGQSIKFGDFDKVPLPLPPLDEQRAIADFLDAQISRIDVLIDKQIKLIAVLRERRASVVTHAVTGGRSPSDMPTSGADLGQWLGLLPEGWHAARPRHLFTERRERSRSNDIHLTPSQTHGVLPQAEYMKMTGNRVVLNLTGSDSMKHIEADDFIIHLRSFQGGLERSHTAGKVSSAYTVLTPSSPVDADFFGWVLKSHGYIQSLRATVNQLRDGQSIRFTDFDKVPLPLPPLSEQGRIAMQLAYEIAEIDVLVAKAEAHIVVARERRAALITAAVTGQVNVHPSGREGQGVV
ncbi:restriction endonuclease subunit S [Cellulomonas cellasea]|nr:restriction endonuclease subunit S [Cellulomonas cellasea]